MASVNLHRLTKIFAGGVTGVSDLSLDAADGEFVVLVGPSGCGKTTTLRMIAGLERPTRGEIYIGQTLANDISPRDRDVAMVFQNYALYPHISVYQNLAFALKMRKVSSLEIDRRIKAAADVLDIGRLLDRKPWALSGGERQRVALAKVLVRDARVYLFDEPLSNLDALLRAQARLMLKELRPRFKAACVYVTHDQSEAMVLADRLCVLCQGVVQQVGKPLDVYEKPANRFVAGFFGWPSMNFFSGQVRAEQGGLLFANKGFCVELPRHLMSSPAGLDRCELILGIRPEHITLTSQADRDTPSISATVSFVENLGNRLNVYLSSDAGERFVVITASCTPVTAGERVQLSVDLGKAHLFEPGPLGRNISILPGTSRS